MGLKDPTACERGHVPLGIREIGDNLSPVTCTRATELRHSSGCKKITRAVQIIDVKVEFGRRQLTRWPRNRQGSYVLAETVSFVQPQSHFAEADFDICRRVDETATAQHVPVEAAHALEGPRAPGSRSTAASCFPSCQASFHSRRAPIARLGIILRHDCRRLRAQEIEHIASIAVLVADPAEALATGLVLVGTLRSKSHVDTSHGPVSHPATAVTLRCAQCHRDQSVTCCDARCPHHHAAPRFSIGADQAWRGRTDDTAWGRIDPKARNRHSTVGRTCADRIREA